VNGGFERRIRGTLNGPPQTPKFLVVVVVVVVVMVMMMMVMFQFAVAVRW